MDSYCSTTIKAKMLPGQINGGLRKGNNGFLGEKIRGGLNDNIFGSQFCKKNLVGKRARNSKPGVTFSVMTRDINKEMAAFESATFFEENSKADPSTVASIILGGGAGTRLFPLTNRRAKPAVPIGGCYRLIDVPMSNCINSGIRKIFILTQFNSFSLNRHLARTYNFGNGVSFGDGFVEVLAATQTPGDAGKRWFQGTADAVRQFIWVFEDAKNKNVENIIILSGDHLYRMDYMDFVQKHIDTNADITVSCVPMDDSRASDYGLMKIDDTGRIVQFSEKPKGSALKSMPPKFDFNDPKTPFYTSPRFLPPTKVEKCRIVDAIVSHGCFLRECSVEHSIVGVRSRLDYGVELKDTMMMGADYYQTESEIANCIIDKNAKIGKDVIIANKDSVEEADRADDGFYIRSGITVILKNSTIKDGTII
ncbi:glucose-1-phosphate adenylyltransferase large subunit chloroplastic/amyloplastic [Phtheirospermum japonicum]|uniref:glucose-1-phosphate adenylyltransferase n=1 Tax=Phtheirospermum japonicum TaxID=374723 RepID=A0A830CRA7_9LAMI|nr:glucose-1-phosphate adenylyltransferase large subunit chloroplastic/amyloplastic [Phtheirospermum japonicum]